MRLTAINAAIIAQEIDDARPGYALGACSGVVVVAAAVILLLFVGLAVLARTVRGPNRKPVGALIATIGAFLVIFATVRLNSLEYQAGRGLGHDDPLPLLFFAGGVPCALVGIWMLFSSRPAVNLVVCPNCKKKRIEGSPVCPHCDRP